MRGLRSRRGFLEQCGLGGLTLTAGAWGGPALGAIAGQDPDLIVINGVVGTMDPAKPTAQAFAVKGDRFLAVGTTEEMKSIAGPRTRIVDAGGGMVVPGFNDTHNHGRGEALLYGVNAGNPYVVEYVTIQSIIDKLKARAAETRPGEWIVANFYDDTKIKDKRPLTIQDIDKASTEHPIEVRLRGGHASVFNSKAFAQAGVTKNTPDILGGTYEKNEKGELSGRVTDNAIRKMNSFGVRTVYSPAEAADRALKGFEFISGKFAEFGLTSVSYDAGDDLIPTIQGARDRKNLKTWISYDASPAVVDGMIQAGVGSGFGDDWFRFGGTREHSLDGGLSSRTMSMTRPYIGVTPAYKGNLVELQKDTNEWAERVHRAGIRMNMHANGEPSIQQALDAYDYAQSRFPRPNTRPKLTHCSLPSAEQMKRIKAADAQPSMFSTYMYYNADKFRYYGADMAEHMMPYRDMINAGINASTGSDFYPGPFDPLMAIQGMVTRKGFNGETWGASQKVTVEEAIRCSTIAGAYSTFEENTKGSITPGKLADYVILSDDLYKVNPEKIIDVKIVETVVGGESRYHA
ncbi:amidohydrolase [Polymorphobacter sp.]|uniref:amidohydrolase n=1 Tax=Polymorphobacter sp. TaxID=1909290 RepID=UPI003F6FE21A